MPTEHKTTEFHPANILERRAAGLANPVAAEAVRDSAFSLRHFEESQGVTLLAVTTDSLAKVQAMYSRGATGGEFVREVGLLLGLD